MQSRRQPDAKRGPPWPPGSNESNVDLGHARPLTSDGAARLAAWVWRPATADVLLFDEKSHGSALRETQTDMEGLLERLPSSERAGTLDELLAIQRGDHEQLTRRCDETNSGHHGTCVTEARAVRDGDGVLLAVRAEVTTLADGDLDGRHDDGALTSFQYALDSLPLRIALMGQASQLLMTNRAWEASVSAGSAIAASRGTNYIDRLHDALDHDAAEAVATGLRSVLAGTTPRLLMNYEYQSPSGPLTCSFVAEAYDGPGEACVVIVSELAQDEPDHGSPTFHARLIDAVDVAVVVTDRDGCVMYWNRAAVRLYGWTAAEARGSRLVDLVGPASGALTSADSVDVLLPDGQFTASRKDGTSFPALVRRASVADATGQPAFTIDATLDVSDTVAERRKLLGARSHLRAVTDNMGEGLFTLDLDGRVTYMNQAAEALLGWSRHDLLGRRMQAIIHVQGADGSELPDIDCEFLAVARDGETRRVDDEVFVSRTGQLIPVAYIASALYGQGDIEGCVVVFEDISERKRREDRKRADAQRSEVIDRIKAALADERFVLYAQPIIDLQRGEIVQQELLLRMCEPSGEIVGPLTFLSIAEQEGLIAEIDRWVILEAVRLAASGSRVELNISGSSIGMPSILEHLKASLLRAHADPALLVFEITETAIIADEVHALAFADGLHALGCGLALDDFGTGYGSFTYLKRLPVDFLKIDVEFVRDVVSDASSRHVIEAVVALAQSFGLRTVGEGVEDSATLELLRGLGVDFGQGFHIGRPAPIPDAFQLLTMGVA